MGQHIEQGTVPYTTDGAATVYRLFDVGYEIDLDAAARLLGPSHPERAHPAQGQAQALLIANPPITITIGSEPLSLHGQSVSVEVSARIFDFGVISTRAKILAPPALSWDDFARFGQAVDADASIVECLERNLAQLFERIRPAIERAGIAPVREDYNVYRVSRLNEEGGALLAADAIRDIDVVPLLLNETRPLSAEARRELLPHRFSYYNDDLAVLTWNNALIIDPAPGNTDVEYLLEFANAQLLELRFYDAVLDAELPKLYDRISAARKGRTYLFNRRHARVLQQMQTLVADTTELVERVENSLKVTDDVYLARVYSAALEIFRGRAWRTGIDRKLGIIRETYEMLNGEAQALRIEALEIAIVLLIVMELVLAWMA